MSETKPKKKKRGRPRLPRDEHGNIIRPEAPEPAPKAPDVELEEVTQSSLEWAEAVMWAVQWAGKTKATVQKHNKAISPMQWAMWDFGQTNYKELAVSLARQAAAILDKRNADKAEDEVVGLEQEAVKELDAFIEAAISEAKGE